MSEDAVPATPSGAPNDEIEAAGDADDDKTSPSGDSDDGNDGDDDEDFEPDAPRRKKKRKSAGEGGSGGSECDRGVGGESTVTENTAAASSQPQRPSGPTVSGGCIEFPLAPVQSRLICTLCMGYFRDPYTITECLHTFCKSCLFFAFRSGFRRCPECETSLEPDPFKEVLSDRTMQTLVEKIFPHLKDADERDEKEFYARRGIKMKKEFQDEAEGSKKATAMASSQQLSRRDGAQKKTGVPDDELEFIIVPDENVERDYQMPPMKLPKLRASGRLKVSNLKRYIISKLQIKASPASVEICCNGDPLGDELSLTFINRTRWIDPSEEVQLTYRFGEGGMF